MTPKRFTTQRRTEITPTMPVSIGELVPELPPEEHLSARRQAPISEKGPGT